MTPVTSGDTSLVGPEPSPLIFKKRTLYLIPKPYLKPLPLNPKAPTLNPEAPTLNPEAPTLNPEAPTLNPKAPTLNPKAPTLNPVPCACVLCP